MPPPNPVATFLTDGGSPVSTRLRTASVTHSAQFIDVQGEPTKERQQLVTRAGVMARGKLELELANLRTLLGNGERIKFETTGKEKEFLEEQLQAGGRKAIVKQYRYSVAVADDQLYWPFQGEYWRDELGTYEYTLTKGCVERSTANRQVTGTQ